MAKKGSIFKLIRSYFGTHPGGILAWVWVTVGPALGSLVLLANHQELAAIELNSFITLILYTLISALLMGLAMLPTTLIAIASGYFFGWLSLPLLILAYLLATLIGYSLGKVSNPGLITVLFAYRPGLEAALEQRKHKESSLIFFVRISPIIPFAVSNFLFATLLVPLRKVIWFGIPGMLPRTLIAFGSGVAAQTFVSARAETSSPIQLAILGGLLVVGILGIYFYLKGGRKSA